MGLPGALFRRRRVVQRAAPLLLLTAAVVAAFGQVVTFEFAYDDFWTIVHNDALERPLRWVLAKLMAGQGPVFTIPDATRPVLVASFWIEHRVWGAGPAGYHLDSLVLYLVVCGLAAAAAFAVTRRSRVALVAGLLFALAPVHAEVVAAVNYREDLIAAAGVLCPIVWLCWPRRKPLEPGTQIFVAVAWAVGLFGKESAVALIPLLLVTLGMSSKRRATWRRDEGAIFALFGVFLVWINWRVALSLGGDDVPRAPRADLASTLLATARFESRAVLESLWPLSSAPEYPKEGPATWVWALALGMIALAVIALAVKRQTRIAAVGVAFSAIAALPASPLVGPINARADRYLFLSVWGGALVWGWAADALGRRLDARRRSAVGAMSLALVLALALVCRHAAAPWHDELSLWSVAVRDAPESPRAWTGLSRALRVRKDLPGAERALEHAFRLDAGFVPAHVTRAYTLLALGEPQLAQAELERLKAQGNGAFRGVARAARCARLGPIEARECIAASP